MVTAPISPPKPPPPRQAPAPAPKAAGSTQANTIATRAFSISQGVEAGPQRIIVYGSGGVGKTSLCASLADVEIKPLFIDIADGTRHQPVARIKDVQTWEELRGVLHSKELFNGFNAVVIDDFTKAEEMAAEWVVRNIRHEKGKPINGIEDYGWGKGLGHVYDEFTKIFGDLDALIRHGLHVVGIAHECTERVPNPSGEDWIRYEPRLQSPKSGKDSIRHRMKEWCDHLLFVGYDTAVNESGKGQGAGTRTIYPVEMPSWVAKSRTLSEPISYEKGGFDLWNLLLKGE